MDAFFAAIEASVVEYMETYKTDLDKRLAEKQRLEEERRKANMDNLRKDMEQSQGKTVVLSTGLKDKKVDDKNMELDEDEDEEVEEDEDFARDREDGSDIVVEDEDERVSRFPF